MSRYAQRTGERGSLRWIQSFVNESPEVLDEAIREASGGKLRTPVEWRSPVRSDDWAEYRDEAFLSLLNIELPNRPLKEFWPRSGPQWDGLGLSESGQVVLVEAKANIPEVISSRSGAGEQSLAQIRRALAETAEFLGITSSCDWSGTFYQYANRIAHLYLLAELNDIDAWLVFVYFIGDEEVRGPASEGEWKAALEVMYGALGLPKRHKLRARTVDVFIDVSRHGQLAGSVEATEA